MDLTCPNCNREIMFDDEFTNFEATFERLIYGKSFTL